MVFLFYLFQDIQTHLAVPKLLPATRKQLLHLCLHLLEQRLRDLYSLFGLRKADLGHFSQCFVRSSLLAVAVLVVSTARFLRKVSFQTHSSNLTLSIISELKIFLVLKILIATHLNTRKFHWKLHKRKLTSFLSDILSSMHS